MLQLVYSPQWFYGKDIIIDVISIILLFLVSFASVRYYFMKRNKNCMYLAVSFVTIAVSFMFKIMTNFTLYNHEIKTHTLGLLTITYQTTEVTGALFHVGFLLHRILSLLGFYLLYSLYQKPNKTSHALAIFLLLVSAYFTESAYYIFHLTLLLILVLIAILYWPNIQRDNKSTILIAVSYITIAVSQLLFILVLVSTNFYVISEIVQLIGYAGLFSAFLMATRHGKKK